MTCALMNRSDDLYRLPTELPVPVDDGACNHLTNRRVPLVVLPSTSGRMVDLSAFQDRTIVYCYPRTGRPDVDPPAGWNEIPGARGCTPQSCSFRDRHRELRALGVQVFGLSTQDSDYQKEAVSRLNLPFELLSDHAFDLTGALRLPTFEVAGMRLIKRLTLVIQDGYVSKVFYPVFPPDRHADEVIQWLSQDHKHEDFKES
jgi:peroxiredoxin